MIEIDPLEVRLSELKIATPEFRERASASRKAPVFSRAKIRRRGGMLLALALLVLGVAATYPAIGQDALTWIGLAPSQIKPLTGSGTYHTVHIEVNGGYADQIVTVVFASFTNNAGCQYPGPYLTDQFGETYPMEGGWGLGVGLAPTVFDPLRGEAARTGASLVLHCQIPVSPAINHDVQVKIAGKLTPAAAKALPTPPAHVVDETTFQIADIAWSGTYLEVHTKLSGKLIDALLAKSEQMTPPANGGLSGVTFPGVFLVEPSGKTQIPITLMNDYVFWDRLKRDHVQEETRLFRVTDPGVYKVVVGEDPKGPFLTTWTVPVG